MICQDKEVETTCGMCGKSFGLRKNMLKHMRMVHKTTKVNAKIDEHVESIHSKYKQFVQIHNNHVYNTSWPCLHADKAMMVVVKGGMLFRQRTKDKKNEKVLVRQLKGTPPITNSLRAWLIFSRPVQAPRRHWNW